jgi:hypothetical protein
MYIKEFTIKVLLLLTALSPGTTVNAQEVKNRPVYEVNAGIGMLIYQTVYTMENSFALEAAVRSKLTGPVYWQTGVRLGLGPVLPDFFGRLILIQEVGIWRPDIGIEIGVTARAQFQDDTGLLAETRKTMNQGTGIAYFSVHAAPLSFVIREKWRLSALELDFGTHFADFGRTLRGQITVLSISRKF